MPHHSSEKVFVVAFPNSDLLACVHPPPKIVSLLTVSDLSCTGTSP